MQFPTQTNNRSQEEFMESLERIINELKAHVGPDRSARKKVDADTLASQSAEAEPFLKPVSKKIAPDYDQGQSLPDAYSTSASLAYDAAS